MRYLLLSNLTSSNIKNTLEDFKDSVDPSSLEFAIRVFSGGFDRYIKRIDQYGFKSIGRVLDAGCGFGQWAIALASLGNRVDAVDVSKDRIGVLSALATEANLDIKAECGTLTQLSFPDNQFDVVFCYGALFCTPWKQSLAELVRVLKPGGYLYVNANGIGYYIDRWQNRRNKSEVFDPAETVGLAFTNAWRHSKGLEIDEGGQVLIEPEELTNAFLSHGMTDVRCDGEGRLKHSSYSGRCIPPFFPANFQGLCGTYEIIGRKE